MTSLRSITISWILALLCVGGCAANEPPKLAEPAEANADVNEESDSYIIDSQARSVAGIAVGMTEAKIRESGWPYETRIENFEGDEYKIYDVSLADGVVLNCTLDLENTLYRIESSSVRIQDQFGLGVNSKLIELKLSYPSGKFIKGIAHSRFANFLTETGLMFYFDHKDLDESCFDYDNRTHCMVDENIRVNAIAIN